MNANHFPKCRALLGLALLTSTLNTAQSQSDLWIKDDGLDIGAEPNTQTACMYCSVDIWVRRQADPNYDPTPFPTASPPWTPQPHQDPCYRDPKTSSPNYIYVRVRNTGSSASSGTETLHVYWAKANTGLNWSSDWVDHLDNPCGGALRLYGYEVTKPRKNGATATAQEQSDYVAAIQGINTASYQFPDGVTYFNKQNVVHAGLAGASLGGGFTGGQNNVIHNNLMFVPWHREFIHRYEVLLREVKPALTLLYWDWTTDPSVTGPIDGPSGFMGAYTGASVGAPFTASNPDPPKFGGIWRQKFGGTPAAYTAGLAPAYQSGTLLASADFPTFWSNIEGPSHNQAHCYTGGGVCSLSTAASDPIFYMLHANADRLWAKWQRNSSASVTRWNPGHAYDPQQASPSITAEMRPWNGADSVRPWTAGDGYIIHKTPLSHSVIDPPIYDDALLKVPVIPPNYCCIIEIPFYPPAPTECAISQFSDPSHVCLLARVEPVNVAETSDLYQNVKNNKRIAWLNTHVQDCNIGPWFALAPVPRIGGAGQLITNPHTNAATITLQFDEAQAPFRSLFDYGQVRLRLQDNLYQAWAQTGFHSLNVKPAGSNNEAIVSAPGAQLIGLALGPRESGHMDLALELNRNYQPPFGQIYHLNVNQYETLPGAQILVGGQNYVLDFNLLDLIQKGSVWKFLDGGLAPAADWTSDTYDDSKWRRGNALFGYGREDAVTDLAGTNGRPATVYFRQSFNVGDPTYYQSLDLNVVQDDGVVVYLNGNEIARLNMPTGKINPATPALETMTGAASRAYRTVHVDNALGLLFPGQNVLAAEVHPATNSTADLSFDLQLAANAPIIPYQPPTVVITSPAYGASVRTGSQAPIVADVLDPDGDLSEVRIYVNNVLITTRTNPPYSTVLDAPQPGPERVSVEAQDTYGHITRTESLFSVVSNLIPVVTMVAPANDSVFPPGSMVQLGATASDPDGGGVKQVIFYVWPHLNFDSPVIQVGIRTSTPYFVAATNLPPGHYAAFAKAVDDQGGVGYSIPLHFVISQPAGTPQLQISSRDLGGGSKVFLLEWYDQTAVLEYSPAITGPWMPAPAAASPYGVDRNLSRSQFYRLHFNP